VETGELLWSNWLSTECLRAIALVTAPYPDVVDYFPGLRMTEIKDFSLENIVEPAPYAWCMVLRSALPAVMERLEALGDLNVHTMRGWPEKPDYLDIQVTDKNADKFHGMIGLQELLHVSAEQTLAIGDGTNDVPLLRAAGVKVAMGNAAPELKVLADHEVATVQQDGWAQAITQFVL
jgi:hydroxymethylpyrimidine pyrophosphatase-like HAD family hydrolase